MGVSTSIEILSQILERYESGGGTVHQVEATLSERGKRDGLSVTVDVAVPLCSAANDRSEPDASPVTAVLGDGGELRLEFPPSIVPSMDECAPESVSTAREDVRVAADGTILVTFALGVDADAEPEEVAVSTSTPLEEPNEVATSVGEDERGSAAGSESGTETESEADPGAETESALEAARNEDLPPYEDVEYLRCLYDSFDTFTAMADALEMDVTSETVRRYMIDAGVHEPASYNTTAGGETEDAVDDDPAAIEATDAPGEVEEETLSPDPPTDPTERTAPALDRASAGEANGPSEHVSRKQLVTDGIGLPDGVELEELIDAIASSLTLYDVHQQLDLDRGRTRELLERLNLIDLVVKRVYSADDPERRPSRDEIVDRIRDSVATER
ncbi:hypothetical protein [Halegenticoccus soli]|uniref:hypothetical protein n=1 Tax=Halegenticoccus soli TaxID=1985678 RepID=UPI000C6E4939|nr:hypothetical protein [Halegenticoccus soli]